MHKHLLVTLAAVLAVGMSASAARAQCAFQHPLKASSLKSNLVQAFVSCGNPGGNATNTTTEGGVPACKPPETFCTQSGNCPGTGWEWDPLAAKGQVQFKVKSACAAKAKGTSIPACSPSSPLNTGPPASRDLEIKMTLKGVLTSATSQPASGTGTLATVARATLNDRMNGDLTVIDFPAGFSFSMTGGKASLDTSADALLNSIGQPGLPPCTSIEVVSIRVQDTNGDNFANLGSYLPQ